MGTVDLRKALSLIQKYCAYQERSQQEVRDKLYSYGLHRNQVEPLIAELIVSGFLKEERFAIAFAGGKFRMKAWGKLKIAHALKLKKIPEKIINIALSQIDEQDYVKTLKKLINERSEVFNDRIPLNKSHSPERIRAIKAGKIAQYFIRRGFEPELVWSYLAGDE